MTYSGNDWRQPSKMTQDEIHARVMAGDRDHDGDIDFQDLPPSARDDTSNNGIPRYDDPIPDERSNIRNLKELKARDILEERARARREAEHDLLIQEEYERVREQNKSPIRKHVERVGRGVSDYLKQKPAMQPPRTAPRQPVRVQAPPTYYAPARTRPQQYAEPARRAGISERVRNMDNGLAGVFGGGVRGNLRQPQPQPRTHADLTSFAAGLLPRGTRSTPSADKPINGLDSFVGSVSGIKKKQKSPTKKPDLNKIFGLKI